MNTILGNSEELSVPDDFKTEETMDAEVSNGESDSEESEAEDTSIDSDNSVEVIADLSDSEMEPNKFSNIVSIHETYSSYYSEDRITAPILTKFEKAKILGVRAEMLSNGADPVISKPYPNNTYLIALEELKHKKIPLIIRRTLPNGTHEDWRLEDLIVRL